MTSKIYTSSLVLITSRDEHITAFGSGFIFKKDNQHTYILTCAHVVKDVGGEDFVHVEGGEIVSILNGSAYELDLAVLTVKGLSSNSSLSISATGQESNACRIFGFHLSGKQLLARPLRCTLGSEIIFAFRNTGRRYKAWDIIVDDVYTLQKGYSGSPLIDQDSGYVIGIVSHMQNQGEQGIAIAIENIEYLDLPLSLSKIVGTASKDYPPTEVITEGSEVTKETPLLIGVLVDASSAMMQALEGTQRRARISRNDANEAIKALVDHIVRYCRTSHGEEVLPKISLFAYGYGLGNKYKAIVKLAHRLKFSTTNPETISSSPVRDLFEGEKRHRSTSTLTALDLSRNWERYEQHILDHRYDAAAGTPRLYEGLGTVLQRLLDELHQPYYESPLLFLISSGSLENNSKEEVLQAAQDIKSLGVQIVSCYIGPVNITDAKRLYAAPLSQWPDEAKLLFECASSISKTNEQANEIALAALENNWIIPDNAVLFVQANQTVMFKEFVKMLIESYK